MPEVKYNTSSTSSTPSTPSTIKSLAVITTHPIQYNAPLFRYLKSIGKFNLKVFYTWGEQSIHVYDPGFGKNRSWDIDLLNGYEHIFVNNVSKDPGSHHFKGIINPDLIDQVASFKPDAILIYGWKFHSHLKLMRHFKGRVPILFRGDSTMLDERPGFTLKKWARQQFLKWVYKHVDHALSPGSASDEYFKWVGLKPHQIHRARHAVENERFMGEMGDGDWELGTRNQESGISDEYLEKRALLWKKELGISEDKKVFLFAGKFEPKKDPLLLIQAFKQLLQKRSDIHLIMVGNGILEEQITKEIYISQFPSTPSTPSTSFNLSQPLSTSLNFSQHPSTSSTPSTPSTSSTFPITLLPFQNQSLMPIVYRLGDVFVLPSKGPGETWGLAINEAMACGLPVISSDKCGGACDLIRDGLNGYIFPARDREALCSIMESVLNDDTKRMGDHARQYILHFDYTDFAHALEAILQ